MRKRKIMILLFLGFSVLGIKTVAVSGAETTLTKNTVLLVNNSQNIEYQNNNLEDISSANPNEFDNPSVGPNGVLERMQSTDVNTKYGNMSIERVQNGFECRNLSNPNAPVLFVSSVNNIYEVGGETDLKALLTPKIISGTGTIVLPNVDTSQPNFGAKYVEAVGADGAITIAPFIYNTVQFKNTINVKSENDVNSLTLNDVLDGTGDDLKLYIANYNKGSNVITIGLSRGVASIQKALPLTIGNNSGATNINTSSKNTSDNATVIQKTNIKVPLLIKVLLSAWTYVIIGIILIAIVSIFCFTGL